MKYLRSNYVLKCRLPALKFNQTCPLGRQAGRLNELQPQAGDIAWFVLKLVGKQLFSQSENSQLWLVDRSVAHKLLLACLVKRFDH
ncbi:hypothetical protein Pan258_31960 [Symmachiella dynata]|nr:hypothetical protein Pan258_31960 [Symmachiella dynata]